MNNNTKMVLGVGAAIAIGYFIYNKMKPKSAASSGIVNFANFAASAPKCEDGLKPIWSWVAVAPPKVSHWAWVCDDDTKY